MKGVKVKIKISFEVKIVKIAITALKLKNNFIWLDFDFLSITEAMYEKKPILSSRIEMLVQERKIIKIFNGLIFAELKKMFFIGEAPQKSKHKQTVAPMRQIIQ